MRERGGSAERGARVGRQRVDPVAHELLKLVGNGQRLARCRDRSEPLERAAQLEREERIAGGHVVDPPQRRAGEAELDPGSKEAVHRAEAERLDVEPNQPVVDERRRNGLARPARCEHANLHPGSSATRTKGRARTPSRATGDRRPRRRAGARPPAGAWRRAPRLRRCARRAARRRDARGAARPGSASACGGGSA